MQLQGKVAIVTGGGIGIGKAIAMAFAGQGADVVVAGEAEPPLREVAAEIERMGRKSLAVLADLLDPGSPEKLIDRTLEKFGKIDILVNNAGVEGPMVNIAEMDLDGWNNTLDINLTGAMLCSRAALSKSMIPRKTGNIINISSGAGRKGRATRSPYNSSKFAIIGFTQSLASEVGRYGIRANAIAPGAVEGERIRRVFSASAKAAGTTYEQIVARSNAMAALGRMVKPEEVANLAVFLASEQSAAITGQTINIDAGTNYN